MKTTTLKETWTIVDDLPVFARINLEAAPPGTTPLVHIHGFAISGSYLVPTAERLAAFYPTYVPDLPGYGRSHHPKKTLTITQLADSLIAYLDLVGVEKATLLGNSMGCVVAIEVARKYPDRVDRAILVSPAGGPHNQPLLRGLPQLGLDALRESPRMVTVALPDYLHFGLLNSLRLFHAMTQYPTVENFMHLQCPTLIVVGVRDPLVSKERIKVALDLPMDVSLVFLQSASHAINYSHPDALASIVHAFLQDRPLLDELAPSEDAVVVGIAKRP